MHLHRLAVLTAALLCACQQVPLTVKQPPLSPTPAATFYLSASLTATLTSTATLAPTTTPRPSPSATLTARPSRTPMPTGTPTVVPSPTLTPLPGPETTISPSRGGTPAPQHSAAISLQTVGQLQELARWGGGTNPGIAYSEGGKILTVVSAVGRVDYDTGTWVGTYAPDGQAVPSEQSSSETLAWEFTEGSVRIFRVHDGQAIATLSNASPPVLFVPDGQRVITGRGGQLALWQLADGQMLAEFAHPHSLHALTVSPDGQLLAASTVEFGWVYVWRLSDGQLLQALDTGTWVAYAPAFSPDSSLIAAIDLSRSINVWRIADGAQVNQLFGAQSPWWSWSGQIQFSPDLTSLAASFSDGEVLVWQLAAREAPVVLASTAPTGQGLAFSANGQWLATGASTDVQVWPLTAGTELPYQRAGVLHIRAKTIHPAPLAISGPSYLVLDLALAPDGKSLAAVVENWPAELRFLEVAPQGVRKTGPSDAAAVLCHQAAYAPAGGLLACAKEDGIEILNTADYSSQLSLPGHSATSVSDLVFSRDGRTLAWVTQTGLLQTYAVDTGLESVGIELEYRPVRSLVLSFDGQKAYGLMGTGIEAWDLATTRQMYAFETYSSADQPGSAYPFVSAGLALSPDEQVLAAASGSEIHLRRASDGALLRVLDGHQRHVTGLAFSPDGRLLASGSADGTLRLWGIAP
jgi:WD40 repeat protein